MKLGFKSTAISDVGLHRDGNEDSALISPVLVAVADGMGGHAAGEVASKIAIESLNQSEKILDIKTFVTDLPTGDGSIVSLPAQVLLPPIPLYLRRPDALTIAERL